MTETTAEHHILEKLYRAFDDCMPDAEQKRGVVNAIFRTLKDSGRLPKNRAELDKLTSEEVPGMPKSVQPHQVCATKLMIICGLYPTPSESNLTEEAAIDFTVRFDTASELIAFHEAHPRVDGDMTEDGLLRADLDNTAIMGLGAIEVDTPIDTTAPIASHTI